MIYFSFRAFCQKSINYIFQIPDTITVVDVKTNDSKGTTEKIYSDGSHEIIYTNGNRKEISADGKSTKVFHINKKEILQFSK